MEKFQFFQNNITQMQRKQENNPTEFELIFYVEKRKYLYQLELNEKEVLLEKLSYFKDAKEIILAGICCVMLKGNNLFYAK